MIGAGVLGGLAAAVFGWLDWVAIPRGTRAKRIGLWHGGGNVVVLALFILSWLLRRDNPEAPPTGAIVAGLMAVVLAVVTAWLGGELVDRLGVGVDEGAHLDSPSSLSELPAGAGLSGVSHRGPSTGYTGAERRAAPTSAAAGGNSRVQ
jgi:4-amino-4-deoxy-L-arabinose transferase-like glycosyltransferase